MARGGKTVFVQIDGWQDVVTRIKKVVSALGDEKKTGPVFLAAAKQIRDAAKGRAPVRTGLLRDNIFAGVRRTRPFPSAVVGVRRKKVFYCWFVEYGTPKAPAHPFLRPAATAAKDEALGAARVELDKLIEECE